MAMGNSGTQARNFWVGLWKMNALVRDYCHFARKRKKLKDAFSDVTAAQIRLLDVVSCCDAPEGLKLKDIASELQVTPGAASTLVDALVKKEMLVRVVAEKDRREVRIRLSESGMAFRSFFSTVLDEISAELVGAATPGDIEIFLKVLYESISRLRNTMEEQRK